MDPKQKKEFQEISKCHSEDGTVETDWSESPSTSYNHVLIRLEGTHTTATETDQSDPKIKLPAINENFPNVYEYLTASQERSSKFDITAVEKKLLFKKNEGEKTQDLVAKKPMEEMIHEMNANIQTIIGMFGPKKNDSNKDEPSTSKTGKRVSFQGSKTGKDTSKKPVAHRSRFDQFLETKKSLPNALRVVDYMKIERNVPDTGQGVLVAECSRTALCEVENLSQESTTPCIITEAMQIASNSKQSAESENINEYLDTNYFDGTNDSRAKISGIGKEDVVIPMYEGLDGRSMSLQPCEHTFHTLHIEAASSPTSSVMYRPPLCVRLWRVFTDLITGLFLCLQVNRDCIFCLGFFVAFVVSASFLTAFFYRTLNVDPQGLQHGSLRKDAADAGKHI